MDIKFDDSGLIPAIIQDYVTGEVLMLAYMNEESYKKTLETGLTHFYSRSRKELWNKGATSGNFQYVKEISLDCDSDSLLIKVKQLGAACHTGEFSCFFKNQLKNEEGLNYKILYDIDEIIKDRKANPKEGSYTNYLFDKGIDKILKKIGEESAEVIIAAKNKNPHETIYEMADLIFHSLVLLNEKEIQLDEIFKELKERYNKKAD
ncbi:phosphoribosyl-ATP pyrophosphatase [Oxobacter pfennigii]|uniref:Histidine biosynthesis bifunctional protein HisIE n=1 Tax=Oxobacter pfennigii TaxID=36849 RepID=A0A0P8YCS0_9CLOT|nr:bifunctional phosphoribosyl-AMP cyclohydrolase/phosphoribosyl-ATP diphosphatase HisIE [Oxobacter pfennigii]KPU44962.1 phosphoribosyl-ATP pyrophosphatase [Oxobacter pfennigii]